MFYLQRKVSKTNWCQNWALPTSATDCIILDFTLFGQPNRNGLLSKIYDIIGDEFLKVDFLIKEPINNHHKIGRTSPFIN